MEMTTGGKLHHADSGGDGGNHHVDYEKWQEQDRAYLEAGLELRQDVGGQAGRGRIGLLIFAGRGSLAISRNMATSLSRT